MKADYTTVLAAALSLLFCVCLPQQATCSEQQSAHNDATNSETVSPQVLVGEGTNEAIYVVAPDRIEARPGEAVELLFRVENWSNYSIMLMTGPNKSIVEVRNTRVTVLDGEMIEGLETLPKTAIRHLGRDVFDLLRNTRSDTPKINYFSIKPVEVIFKMPDVGEFTSAEVDFKYHIYFYVLGGSEDIIRAELEETLTVYPRSASDAAK